MFRPLVRERECAQSVFWVRLLIWASRNARDELASGPSRTGAPSSR
jgi:hypothetical protein